MNQRKVLLSIFVLVSFLMSLGLAFNIFGNGVQHTFAQSSGATVTDFYISSGQGPWGTTFDNKGNVWVANYSFGVDQFAVTPDGSSIYMS